MKNLRPISVENPVELQFDILNQVARNLDMSSIRGVILWSNIIVLQQSRGVEIMNETIG